MTITLPSAAAAAPHALHPSAIGPLTPHLYRPDVARPLRAKLQHLSTDTRVVPH